jgi:uncharacterized small protein (DUF1192 family)
MPDIGPFEFYIDAFRELSTTRPSAFGIGPIPFTAIVEYARIYEVEDFDDFIYFIRLMDNEILRLENERNKKQANTNGNTNANPKNSR